MTTYNLHVPQPLWKVLMLFSVSILLCVLVVSWLLISSSRRALTETTTSQLTIPHSSIKQGNCEKDFSNSTFGNPGINAAVHQRIALYPQQHFQVLFSELNHAHPLVSYQSNEPMLAASLIKLLILAKALDQKRANSALFSAPIHIKNSQKVLGSGLLRYVTMQETLNANILMYLMITESDNTATNILIESLGQSQINQYAKRLGLQQTILRHSLMQPEHLKQPCQTNNCNVTSPQDLTKLLISLNQNPEARFILSHQVDRSGIPVLFPQEHIYNKTGTLLHQRSEAAIIEHNGHTYLLVVSITGLQDPRQGNTIIHETLEPIKSFIDRD